MTNTDMETDLYSAMCIIPQWRPLTMDTPEGVCGVFTCVSGTKLKNFLMIAVGGSVAKWLVCRTWNLRLQIWSPTLPGLTTQ